MKPAPDAPLNPWRLYVAAGSTRDERVRRLGECPEALRETVEWWVRRFFEEQQSARRK